MVAVEAECVMQRAINIAMVIMLAGIALALWRSARENRSQPYVPMESTKPR